MTPEFFNIDSATSYATEANLMKALEKLGFADKRPMVVRNRAGRYTAIFSLSHAGINGGGYIGIFAAEGFKTFS